MDNLSDGQCQTIDSWKFFYKFCGARLLGNPHISAFGKQMRWIILYSFGSRIIAIVISQSLWICFSFVIHRHSSPPLIVIPFYAQSKNLSSKYYNCRTILVYGKHTGSDRASNVTKDVSIYAMWLKKQGVGKLDVHVFGDFCSGTPTTSISLNKMRKKTNNANGFSNNNARGWWIRNHRPKTKSNYSV